MIENKKFICLSFFFRKKQKNNVVVSKILKLKLYDDGFEKKGSKRW